MREQQLASNAARPLREAPELADRLGTQVVEALIDEVTLAPKPGLVDIRNSGAHHDLDWKLIEVFRQSIVRHSNSKTAQTGGEWNFEEHFDFQISCIIERFGQFKIRGARHADSIRY